MSSPPSGKKGGTAMRPEDQERYQKLFKELDKNKDGTISVKELSTVLKEANSRRKGDAPSRAQSFMQKTDANADTTMSFGEFVQYVTNHETQLKLAFKQLDRNNDNVVDAGEIQMAMADLGVKVGREEAEKLLKKMDRNGSLNIDYSEWRDFLMFAGTTDIREIMRFWRKAATFDIGENSVIPDDFSDDEKKTGVAMKTLVSGGVAGAVSRTSTAPLDRLKIMWQAHGGKSSKGGMVGAIKHMVQEGGVASLWRGNGVNCIKIAPESAIKFLAYEQYKLLVTGGEKRDVTLGEKFVSGALAGATAQTLIYPMEVLKTRMCLRKTGQYSSIFDCARKVFHEGGLSVFYRGYLPNILGILPYAGIDLALYETFKNMYLARQKEEQGSNPPIYVSLVAGATASVCGQVATYPLALVRTKLQTKSKEEMKAGASMMSVFRGIVKHDGPTGLYRGLGPNMLKVIPAVSISYAVFEQCRGYMGLK